MPSKVEKMRDQNTAELSQRQQELAEGGPRAKLSDTTLSDIAAASAVATIFERNMEVSLPTDIAPHDRLLIQTITPSAAVFFPLSRCCHPRGPRAGHFRPPMPSTVQ